MLKGLPGKVHLCDTVHVVLCHIEVKSVFTLVESPVDTDKDMADPADNHDGLTKELASPFAIPLITSANVNTGTVVGTVSLTRLPNPKEAREIITVHTKDDETNAVDISPVLDPLTGG